MGSCSSVQKGKNSSVVTSQIKGKIFNGKNAEIVLESKNSLKDSEFGSKREIFFDSRAWIDSDCEDDFFSVNGDFTPSGGTTPNNNPTISLPMQRSNNSFTFELRLDPSPTGRKRLSELFQRNPELTDCNEEPETNMKNQEMADQIIHNQARDTVRPLILTPGRDLKPEKKAKKAADWCLPSFGFGYKQQKMSSVDCSA